LSKEGIYFLFLSFYVILANKILKSMLKLLTSCFMFFFVFTITAQKNLEEDAIKEVIATFFKGLHTGDSAVVSKTFHKDIKIQTTTT